MDTKGSEPDLKSKTATTIDTLSDGVQGILSSTADRLRSSADSLKGMGSESLVKVGVGVGAKAVDQATDRETIADFWAEASSNPDIAGGELRIPTDDSSDTGLF